MSTALFPNKGGVVSGDHWCLSVIVVLARRFVSLRPVLVIQASASDAT
jgi:hypothetical protein